MTDDQLHDAILADAPSKALADAGDDAGAALAVATTLPAEVVPHTYLTDRGVIAAFANPADGEAALQGFAAAAGGDPPNPLFARVLTWLKPSEGGVDFGNPVTRAMLDQLQQAGALTAPAVATLKVQAERRPVVSPDQVSRAWARYRPGGKVVS